MNTSMAVSKEHFFQHIDNFIDYRETIYEASEQTIKSNKIDLALFKNFVEIKDYHFIDGHTVMDFQYYLKQQRQNCGASMNRKIFTLRSYSKFLKLEQVPNVNSLPFYDVLKCRQGYKTRANALTENQVKTFFQHINRNNFLGVRDYAVYALMYKLGVRVGEVHRLNMADIDFDKKELTVLGKGKKRHTLYIDDEMNAILTWWLAVRKHFLNSEISKAVFLSKKGNRLAIRTMEDNFKKILNNLNINVHFNVTCHTLAP
jgi:site-specific recombinase XerD